MFGPCKICIEKEQRIAELKEQITYFKSVLNPPPRINKYEMEQDYTLEGGGREQLSFAAPVSEEDRKQQEEQQQAILQEFNEMISGTSSN